MLFASFCASPSKLQRTRGRRRAEIAAEGTDCVSQFLQKQSGSPEEMVDLKSTFISPAFTFQLSTWGNVLLKTEKSHPFYGGSRKDLLASYGIIKESVSQNLGHDSGKSFLPALYSKHMFCWHLICDGFRGWGLN